MADNLRRTNKKGVLYLGTEYANKRYLVVKKDDGGVILIPEHLVKPEESRELAIERIMKIWPL